MGSDILSHEYAPLLGPRLDVDIGTLDYRPLQKLVRHRSAFASLVLQKLNGQDRLTEVGHSVDGGVFQALLRRLMPLADTLAIVGEFLSWSGCGFWLCSGVATPSQRP